MRLAIVILLLIHLTSYAGEPAAQKSSLDAVSAEALRDTQELMRDNKLRQKAVMADPAAREADEKAGYAAGSLKNKDEMYDIAAEITAKIAEQAGGDPLKMQQLVNEAQKDPKAFYEKMFDAKQKARVKSIAEQSSRVPTQAPTPK